MRAKFAFVGGLLFAVVSSRAAEIEPAVTENLKTSGRVPVIVSLEVAQLPDEWADVPRGISEHAEAVRNLQGSFEQTVGELRAAFRGLKAEKTLEEATPLWIIGALSMNVDRTTLAALASNRRVRAVHYDRELSLPEVGQGTPPAEEKFTYGLAKMGVPYLLQYRPQLTGAGVVAGVIDTGIDAGHPDLAGKVLYFKDFSRVPAGEVTAPTDGHGHGTHVAGTIAGGSASGKAIGVAPDVKLVIARIFDANGSTTMGAILNAMQWMTDPDGNPNTVNDMPYVVNNSWGGDEDRRENSPLNAAVKTWRKLKIFPCFAAGNSGPDEGSVGTPALYPSSFAVGATDENDRIASFSSRGPGSWIAGGRTSYTNKPDASAPGVDVFSSIPGGKYDAWSGTSMATPHVTGAVVLVYQAFPHLTVDQMIARMTMSAHDLGEEGFDFDFGFGRIDLPAAIMEYMF